MEGKKMKTRRHSANGQLGPMLRFGKQFRRKNGNFGSKYTHVCRNKLSKDWFFKKIAIFAEHGSRSTKIVITTGQNFSALVLGTYILKLFADFLIFER
jgi:hypothetical protein